MTQEELEQMFGGTFSSKYSSGGGLGGFSDFFETLFGGLGRQPAGAYSSRGARSTRLQDSEHTLQISLQDSLRGTTCSLEWEGGKRIEAKIPPGVKTGRPAGRGRG